MIDGCGRFIHAHCGVVFYRSFQPVVSSKHGAHDPRPRWHVCSMDATSRPCYQNTRVAQEHCFARQPAAQVPLMPPWSSQLSAGEPPSSRPTDPISKRWPRPPVGEFRSSTSDRVELGADVVSLQLEVVSRLQVGPETITGTEETSQPQRRVGRCCVTEMGSRKSASNTSPGWMGCMMCVIATPLSGHPSKS